jgi:cytochrome P450
LAKLQKSDITDQNSIEDLKGVTGVLFGGGSDTTAATLMMFLLAMVLNPDAFRKAQNEIDKIVGQDRLPDFGDRQRLPYVECVLQETIRRYPIAPGGIPHLCTEDNVYNGMLIPKDAMIIFNNRLVVCLALEPTLSKVVMPPLLRAMSLDERVYRDAESFYPERFLPKPDGYGEPHFKSAFGYGRR